MSNLATQALQQAINLAIANGDTNLAERVKSLANGLEDISPELMQLIDNDSTSNAEAFGRIHSAFAPVCGKDEMASVYVIADQIVGDHKLHDDDGDVRGTYLIKVPAYLSEELKAEAALDMFHNKIGIASLEDFDITVAMTLPRADNYDNGKLERLTEFGGECNSVF